MQQPNDKKPSLSWSTPVQSTPAPVVKEQATSTPKLLTPAPQSNSKMAGYVGMFVGGLVVGIVLASIWSATHKSDTAATSNTVATTNSSSSTDGSSKKSDASVASGVVLGSDELTVSSPQAAGQSVSIRNAVASKPTWVVVYEDTAGKPGNVLGAQLFFTTGSGTVTLLRATVPGQTYFVGRSIDNGDHKYQKAGDAPVVDANGNAQVVSFMTQ